MASRPTRTPQTSPLTGASGAPRMFNADLAPARATVAPLAAQDRAVRRGITVARDLRLACLVLAVVLAGAAWYALSRRRSPPASHHPHARKRHGGNGRQQITGPAPEFGIENGV